MGAARTSTWRQQYFALAGWVGLVACAGFLALYFAMWNGGWKAPVGGPGGYMALLQGRVLLAHSSDGAYRVPFAGVMTNGPGADKRIVWGFEHWSQKHSQGAFIPLWVFASMAITPTSVLWGLRLRAAMRRRRDRCSACGYDLSGLTPGAVCPECGRAR